MKFEPILLDDSYQWNFQSILPNDLDQNEIPTYTADFCL